MSGLPLEKGTAHNLRDLDEGPAYSISLTAENEQGVVKRLDFCLTLTGAEAESVAEGEGRRKRHRVWLGGSGSVSCAFRDVGEGVENGPAEGCRRGVPGPTWDSSLQSFFGPKQSQIALVRWSVPPPPWSTA